MKIPHPQSIEPSLDQLTVVNSYLKAKKVPWVDFAIFGPYNARTQRANAFAGYAWGPSGVIQNIDFKGPPTIEGWEACFKVFATTMIMLDVVDPYVLLGEGSYSAFIIDLAKQFGIECYPRFIRRNPDSGGNNSHTFAEENPKLQTRA